MAVRSKYLTLDDLASSFNMVSDTLEKIVAGQPASFSWRVLAQRKPAETNELRGFIEVRPVLDYGALEPGHAAIAAIRAAAAEIAPQYQATVRLTGPVPMADEEFATLKENAELNGVITLGIVLLILWLALRSRRLILAVFINLFVGLAITAAVGLFMVGAFNLISVSFAVLFVGIGVDFGIQYAVRYRHERHEVDNLPGAIRDAGKYVGAPLTLAAGATAAGFLSFLPTAYRGVSELGLIAGCGMLIAFATSITLLPALIRVLNPPGEPEALGYHVAGAGRCLHGAQSRADHRRRPPCWSSPVCRCSTGCGSTSTRSTCAAPTLSWSQPISSSAASRNPTPTRSAYWLHRSRRPTRSPRGLPRCRRSRAS